MKKDSDKIFCSKAKMAKKPKQRKRTKKLTPAKKLENKTTLKAVEVEVLLPRLPT